MADVQLLALSYLYLSEALAALDDQNLQQELVRIYYPTFKSLLYSIQNLRPDLIAVLFNLNIGECHIRNTEELEAVLESLAEYKTNLDNLSLIRSGDFTFSLSQSDEIQIITAFSLNPQIKSFHFGLGYLDQGYSLDFITQILGQNQIQSLNLSYNNCISKSFLQFAEVLQINTSLTSLDLSSVHMNNDMVISIATALFRNRTLESMSLMLQDLAVEGLDVLAIAQLSEALILNNKLTKLSLSDSMLDWEIAHVLFPGLTQNRSITDLDLTYIFKRGIVDRMETYTDLVNLIQNNKVIKSLNLSQLKFEQNKELILDALATNKALTTLNFTRILFAMSLLSGLIDLYQKNWNLTSLDLTDTRMNTVTENNIETIQILAESLASNSVNLRNLILNDNLHLDPSFIFKALKTNSILTSLSLARIKLPGQSLNILSDSLINNKTLKYLDLSDEFIFTFSSLVPGLTENQGLTELDFHLNGLRNSDALMIIKILTVNHSLARINLEDNLIDAELLKSIQILLDRNLNS